MNADTSTRNFPSRTAWIGLVIFVICLHALGLGNHGLLEPDEGRYANMASEWMEFGEHHWAEPVLSDVGHFDKPPLIYWTTGASFLLFGRHEAAARLPSILGGLLALLGIALLARRMAGDRAAWWSVLVAATSFQYWALTHLLSPDMLMCGFATLGASLTLHATKGRSLSWLWWIAGALCWTLAWWTKATAALVPLAALSLALLLNQRKDLLAALRPVRLFLVILALGSPWYVAMLMKHQELWDFFFHRELAGRITGHEDGRRGIPGYHLGVAFVFWLPWWPVLILPAKENWARWRQLNWREKFRAVPWEVTAALGVIAVFSFVSSKLVTYILPGLPFLAIAVGREIARRQESFSFQQWPGRTAATAAVLIVLTAFTIPHFETSLGRNSSTRQVIEEARERGASRIVFDEFWPGAEFYFGEFVWFVDVKDLVQVHDLPGQVLAKHFLSKKDIVPLVRSIDEPVWLVQYEGHHRNPQKWTRNLLGERPDPDSEPIRIGDFYLWRVR